MKSFRIHGKKGIDDLVSHSPYCGTPDWPVFCPYFGGLTEEEYKADRLGYEKRIDQVNADYIERLKTMDEYGQEYHTDFQYEQIAEFDEPSTPDYSKWAILMPVGHLAGHIVSHKMGVNYINKEEKATFDKLDVDRFFALFGPEEVPKIVPWDIDLTLPPLKVFLGWTPMKEFIRNCEPFIDREKSDNVQIDNVALSIEEIHQLMNYQGSIIFDINRLGIPKERQGK